MRAMVLITFLVAACASTQEQVARSGYLTVPGGSIYYEEAGEGPAVVLIHGAFGDRRMWNAQFADLARDFHVVRYDHRGFGKSARPDSAYSPVNDLLRLLDHLELPKAHLVGNSLGGGVALDFAVQHPDRVDRLVVVSSGANGYPYTDDDVATMVATFRAAKEQGADAAAAMWLNDPMIAVASIDVRSAALVREMVTDNKNIFAMEDWPWDSMKPRAYERLGELRMPVLFIIGGKDTPTTQRVAEATASRLPNAETFRMPGADHLPQMVEPEVFTRKLIEFLR